jgi:hypothetical protein
VKEEVDLDVDVVVVIVEHVEKVDVVVNKVVVKMNGFQLLNLVV